MNTRLKVTLSLAAAGFLAAGVQAVRANPSDAKGNDTATRTVRFGDLNLGTQAGKQALQGRLRTAAGEVCNQVVGTHYGYFALNSKCRSTLVEEALAKVFKKGDIQAGQLAVTYKSGKILLAVVPAP